MNRTRKVIFVAGTLEVLLAGLFAPMERWVLHWHESQLGWSVPVYVDDSDAEARREAAASSSSAAWATSSSCAASPCSPSR